jgi:hypothetical protein
LLASCFAGGHALVSGSVLAAPLDAGNLTLPAYRGGGFGIRDLKSGQEKTDRRYDHRLSHGLLASTDWTGSTFLIIEKSQVFMAAPDV